jgi:hypothetical protein
MACGRSSYNCRVRLILVLVLAGIGGAVITVAAPAEEEASLIGQKWLALLDDQKYEESWNQAGSMFRSEVMPDQWVAVLKRLRQPMGPMLSRTTARVDFVKTLRGAPDGDYAIIHYTTSFQNKAVVTERLTLVKEDGRWQAAAYATH